MAPATAVGAAADVWCGHAGGADRGRRFLDFKDDCAPPEPPKSSTLNPEADALAFARAVHDLAAAPGGAVSRQDARKLAQLPASPRFAQAARIGRDRDWIVSKHGVGGGYIAGQTPLPD